MKVFATENLWRVGWMSCVGQLSEWLKSYSAVWLDCDQRSSNCFGCSPTSLVITRPTLRPRKLLPPSDAVPLITQSGLPSVRKDQHKVAAVNGTALHHQWQRPSSEICTCTKLKKSLLHVKHSNKKTECLTWKNSRVSCVMQHQAKYGRVHWQDSYR